MARVSPLCREFARILGAEPSVVNGVCTATRLRRNLRPTILGVRTRSVLAIPQLFSFEPIGRTGRALNLGETVILQSELNRFISALRRRGITVTAFHNHWLFERPRLMFIHFESIDRPLSFARKVRAALRTLRGE